MVNWDIEETLDLICVKVHSDKAINTSCSKHISNKLCTDSNSWLIFSVLTCPTEVRDYSNNLISRSTLSSVYHKKKLHQIVGIWECRLNDKHIVTTNTLFVAYSKFTVSEVLHIALTKRTTQLRANLLCQIFAISTRENFKRSVLHCCFLVCFCCCHKITAFLDWMFFFLSLFAKNCVFQHKNLSTRKKTKLWIKEVSLYNF